jgi:gliding motility-associated-like protein
MIEGLDSSYPDATVTIYNRWGNMVFDTYGDYSANPWYGQGPTGKDLPDGQYYYVIKTGSAEDEPMAGSVSLLR